MRRVLTAGMLVGAVVPAAAHAWYFDSRVVERVGTTDVPIGGSLWFQPGTSHRLRIQLGLFDDTLGPAPDGGLVAWNSGSIITTGNGVWTRTPGRLAPFLFAPQPSANGVPTTDPFESLSEIDCFIGPQVLPWMCDGEGNPLPLPQPVIQGRNEFVSVYEVTVFIPDSSTRIHQFTWSGHYDGVNRWILFNELSVPPNCETGEPGSAWWNPIATPEESGDFTRTLTINVVPGPGGIGLVGAAVFACAWRRRVPPATTLIGTAAKQ